MVGDCSRAQEWRAVLGVGGQVHKKQHQSSFLLSSWRGVRTQEAVREQRWGPEGGSLEAE